MCQSNKECVFVVPLYDFGKSKFNATNKKKQSNKSLLSKNDKNEE